MQILDDNMQLQCSGSMSDIKMTTIFIEILIFNDNKILQVLCERMHAESVWRFGGKIKVHCCQEKVKESVDFEA